MVSLFLSGLLNSEISRSQGVTRQAIPFIASCPDLRSEAHDCALSHRSAALERLTGQLLDESLGLFEKLSEAPRLVVLPMKDPRRDNRRQGSLRAKHPICVQDVINVLAALERWIHNNPVELVLGGRWIKFQEVAVGKMDGVFAIVFFPKDIEEKAIHFAIRQLHVA